MISPTNRVMNSDRTNK